MEIHPAPDGLKSRDIAASQLSAILRDARIAHIFVGGYAASLLGSPRLPRVSLPIQRPSHYTQIRFLRIT